MIPDLAVALPALVLWIRFTQLRLEALERQLGLKLPPAPIPITELTVRLKPRA